MYQIRVIKSRDIRKKPKGRSSLTKWECPECGLKVRMGIKGNPELRHDPCKKVVGGPVFLVRFEDTVLSGVTSINTI
jgi:hypothetical protein